MQSGVDGCRDVVDVDAIGDLPRLEDTPCGTGAKLIDGAAAGAVNAGKAENDDGLAGLPPKTEPVVFSFEPSRSALRAGMGRRRFIDPAAVSIAVNTYAREIADPGNRRDSTRCRRDSANAGSPLASGGIESSTCVALRRASATSAFRARPSKRNALYPSASGRWLSRHPYSSLKWSSRVRSRAGRKPWRCTEDEAKKLVHAAHPSRLRVHSAERRYRFRAVRDAVSTP